MSQSQRLSPKRLIKTLKYLDRSRLDKSDTLGFLFLSLKLGGKLELLHILNVLQTERKVSVFQLNINAACWQRFSEPAIQKYVILPNAVNQALNLFLYISYSSYQRENCLSELSLQRDSLHQNQRKRKLKKKQNIQLLHKLLQSSSEGRYDFVFFY